LAVLDVESVGFIGSAVHENVGEVRNVDVEDAVGISSVGSRGGGDALANSSVLEDVASVETDQSINLRDSLAGVNVEGEITGIIDGNIGALVSVLGRNGPQKVRNGLLFCDCDF